MSITATVVNDTIKLPIHVPNGTRVEISLPNDSDDSSREETVPEPLQVFRRLQREVGLTPEAAVAWKNRVVDARR